MLEKIIKIGIITVFSVISLSAAAAQPWRLNQALGSPEWLSLSGVHRTRFETLDEQYRAGRNGGDQGLFFRTLIRGEIALASLKFVGEMIDSRSRLTDSGSPLDSTFINPTDILQAYLAFPIQPTFFKGSQSELRLGRFTMNIGKRRFVSRNGFRNTINAFTGIDWQWQGKGDNDLRMFYTLPVQRLFDGSPLDNQAAFDKQDGEVSLWGIDYQTANVPWRFSSTDAAEIFMFGLNEKDTPGRPTSDRDIYTLGFRVFNAPTKNQIDYEIEMAYQFGDSRASSTATIDLDHEAHFEHFELGYSFDTLWSPRLIAEYDYASGDQDPGDTENNRFQTLFGSRGFDFGSTSLYGAFARANLSSPGLRLRIKPLSDIKSYFTLRGFWLASGDDVWTTARIVPPDQNTYIGTQLEGHVQWSVIPGNIRLETGFLHLIAGDVMKDAGKSDATYVYGQVILTF